MNAQHYIEFIDTEDFYNNSQLYPVPLTSQATKYNSREEAFKVSKELKKRTRVVTSTVQTPTS